MAQTICSLQTDKKSQFEEDALIGRARQGDSEAFGSLVTRYRKRIYTLCYQMTFKREDAEDMVQETFLRAYRAIGKFEEGGSFYTWIYRIATNLCLSRLSRNKHRNECPLEDCEFPQFPLHRADHNPDVNLERRELVEKIRGAIENLPARYRTIVVLKTFQGLSYDEIADVLKIPKGTVMSRLNRARVKLKGSLRQYVRETENYFGIGK
ncbi:MAG: RNA polymerase sigma factor [bacterium]